MSPCLAENHWYRTYKDVIGHNQSLVAGFAVHESGAISIHEDGCIRLWMWGAEQAVAQLALSAQTDVPRCAVLHDTSFSLGWAGGWVSQHVWRSPTGQVVPQDELCLDAWCVPLFSAAVVHLAAFRDHLIVCGERDLVILDRESGGRRRCVRDIPPFPISVRLCHARVVDLGDAPHLVAVGIDTRKQLFVLWTPWSGILTSQSEWRDYGDGNSPWDRSGRFTRRHEVMAVREITSQGQIIMVSCTGRWWVYELHTARVTQWSAGPDPTYQRFASSASPALVALTHEREAQTRGLFFGTSPGLSHGELWPRSPSSRALEGIPVVPFESSFPGRLPSEVWRTIVRRICIDDLGSLMRVCHSLRDIGRAHRVGGACTVHNSTRIQAPDRFVLSQPGCARHLKVEVIEDSISSYHLWINELVTTITAMPCLRTLHLDQEIVLPSCEWARLDFPQGLCTSIDNLPRLSELRVRHLMLQPFRRVRLAYGVYDSFPPSIRTLNLDFRGGITRREAPHLNLDDLPRLERLTILGRPNRGARDSGVLILATQPHPRLAFLRVCGFAMSLDWLYFVRQSLRHIVASGMSRSDLPKQTLTLERVEVVELFHCGDSGEPDFLATMRQRLLIPGMRYFSMSADNREALGQAVSFVHGCHLEALALHLLKGGYLCDTNPIYSAVDQSRRETGFPRRCLIHGLVRKPSHHHNTPNFHIAVDLCSTSLEGWTHPMLFKEEARARRVRLLLQVDPEKQLFEREELERWAPSADGTYPPAPAAGSACPDWERLVTFSSSGPGG
ncbi:uncharacterized protein A1O9_13090 [Exophiala aquamarina CBS 119918]|uniref:F-box domain-containing protein n=1 Tax=Exophiala aquamarina CBS 119918 TaxID=1182545 RepID=A0A072NTB8_9EURO|nr:uncharacterized protein A1O9_13090 [Exophiala aquamarina CBS 119918]KEF50861.1 hypothetical protein A1O9_13090 [Exophiala aquamarina CBS 119918]